MKPLALCLACLVLASCGADGDPLEPEVGAGVSIGTDGISTNANVGLTNGIVSIGLDL